MRHGALAQYTCDKQQNCVATSSDRRVAARMGRIAAVRYAHGAEQQYAQCARRQNTFAGKASAARLSRNYGGAVTAWT